MTPPLAPATTTALRERTRRAGLKLAVLVAIAVTGFLGTRVLAHHVRARTVRDAAASHARGVAALKGGRVDEGLEALRIAMVKDRGESEYALSYAEALVRHGKAETALRVLIDLRQRAPDDPRVNLDLARLEAHQGDVPEALHYYRSALYAPWPSPDDRSAVRLELIDLLLDHGERARALAEIAGARAIAPDRVETHVALARRLERAAAPADALDELRRALRLDTENVALRTDAGRLAFALGDYEEALEYWSSVPPGNATLADSRTIATLVLSTDPLQPRLTTAQRRARMQFWVNHLRGRLRTCPPETDRTRVRAARPRAALELEQLSLSLDGVESDIRRTVSRDSDRLEDELDALEAARNQLNQYCPSSTTRDRALALIGRRHGSRRP